MYIHAYGVYISVACELKSRIRYILADSETNAHHGSMDYVNSSSCSGDTLRSLNVDVKPRHLCDNCNQPAFFVCSGCKTTWYCSQLCQASRCNISLANCLVLIAE